MGSDFGGSAVVAAVEVQHIAVEARAPCIRTAAVAAAGAGAKVTELGYIGSLDRHTAEAVGAVVAAGTLHTIVVAAVGAEAGARTLAEAIVRSSAMRLSFDVYDIPAAAAVGMAAEPPVDLVELEQESMKGSIAAALAAAVVEQGTLIWRTGSVVPRIVAELAARTLGRLARRMWKSVGHQRGILTAVHTRALAHCLGPARIRVRAGSEDGPDLVDPAGPRSRIQSLAAETVHIASCTFPPWSHAKHLLSRPS